MSILTIYGIGVLLVFVIGFLIMNYQCFYDPIITALNLSTAALIAVLWPVMFIILIYSGLKSLYDRFTKD